MNEDALIEFMELLKEFEEYSYFRDSSLFLFTNLTSYQFALIYDIIQRYGLRHEINSGLRVWLN